MNILSIRNVVKTYGSYNAVDHVNLEVPKGKIFGMLGPNGAGKTSLIRMITSITRADEGEIFIDGEQLNRMHPNHIGYMPEERGLYKKMKVGEQLLYLARLKGLSPIESTKKIKYWLEKFDITSWWDTKIGKLSKGMQQKVQFIATVVHHPKLIILDEPFSGLDPINTNLIKDEIYALCQDGASILFSTHRMEQVEQICEEIALINKGKIILNGNVNQIKESFKEHKYLVEFEGELPKSVMAEHFKVVDHLDKGFIIKVEEGHSSNELLRALIDNQLAIRRYQEILPSLNEIFIKKVGESNE